jgi:hypothetical protein
VFRLFLIHENVRIPAKVLQVLENADVKIEEIIDGCQVQDVVTRIIGLALVDGYLLDPSPHAEKKERRDQHQEEKGKEPVPFNI